MSIRRTITIELDDFGGFTVREGELYCDGLCWDEMLGQVCTLTHPDIKAPRYPMLNATQQRLREELSEARAAHVRAERDIERISRQIAEGRA